MKKFLLFICVIFINGISIADTVNLNWQNGDNLYSQSTCTVGGDLIVPSTPPTKYGYNFVGWNVHSAKELEYIDFNRSNYIDTGIMFDTDEIEYETKVRVVNQNYYTIFGFNGMCSGNVVISDNAPGSMTFTSQVDVLYIKVGKTSFGTSVIKDGINTYRLHIKKSNHTFNAYINEDVFNRSFSGTVTSDKNIFIGKIGESSWCGFVGRMYYLKIKKDGVLVRDFVPALDTDGVVCFYDRVTKTFFYNQGNGYLSAGPIKE